MNLVLDASVALAWAFEDGRGDASLRVLDALESSEAVTSSLWPLEIANGLLTAERHGRISASDANRFSALLLELPIVVEPAEPRRAFESVRQLARSRSLTSYDASYLEIAMRLGLPLATLDGKLAAAADAEGVVRFGA